MKRILNVKAAIGALVLVVSGMTYLALLPEPEAMFTPGVCTYYSNNKYRTVVGQRGSGCCGEGINWGVVTAFRRCEPMYCLDVVCPGETQ